MMHARSNFLMDLLQRLRKNICKQGSGGNVGYVRATTQHNSESSMHRTSPTASRGQFARALAGELHAEIAHAVACIESNRELLWLDNTTGYTCFIGS